MNNIIERIWNQGGMVGIEDLQGLTFQDEALAHTFKISGVDTDGNAIALSGTPSGVMLRADNTDVALTCAVSDGCVTAELPAECYDVPGRAGITIFLTSDSKKTAIYAAVVSVARTQSGTAAPGTTASVVDLVNAIETAISQIPASDTNLKGALAATYSNSALYGVGSYAWYDGKLYKCITAITTAETWNSAHWTEAKLANDVCDLKNAFRLYDRILQYGVEPHVGGPQTMTESDDKKKVYYNNNTSATYYKNLMWYDDSEWKYAPNNLKVTDVSEYLNTTPIGGIDTKVETQNSAITPNLFNNDVLTIEGVYIKSDGTNENHADFSASDFIQCSEGEKFVIIAPIIANTGKAIAFYSSNSYASFISGVSTSTGNENIETVAPAGAKYVRFSYRTASGDFKCVVNVNDSIKSAYNYTDSMIGKTYDKINYDNSTLINVGKYIKNNGSIANHEDFATSDFILSCEGSKYVVHAPIVANNYKAVAFYSSNTVSSFISGISLSAGNIDVEVTAPAGTKYVRFAYRIGTGGGPFSCSAIISTSMFQAIGMLEDQISNLEKPRHLSFSVIGDSYTAFPGWVPSGQSSYYPTGDVTTVDNMWWYQLAKEMQWKPLIIDGYSGTTVSNNVRSSHDISVSYINRVKNTMGAMRTLDAKPDVIFVLGGQNDNSTGTVVGTCKYSGWTDSDLLQFAPAFCYLIDYLMKWNPGCEIINISNDVGPSSDMISAMAEACTHYGIKNIVLTDVDRSNGHPTAQGMTTICSAVISGIV